MVSLTEQDAILYKEMLRIRLFEERVLVEFSRGQLFGTTHTCIGQEADAVGVLQAARRSDIVFSNHRGHGHYLAHGGDMRALAAELMGKATGTCGGRGGSQHLHFGSFYSNGVQGGTVPCATGMALAEKQRRSNTVTIAFLGDGTLGEGVVYESLNMAALWRLPIVYVLENNGYAQTTPVHLNLAGNIAPRFASFGIEPCELNTTDVREIYQCMRELIDCARGEAVPRALILHTYRFSAHSKGDDTRDPVEVQARKRFDPLVVHGQRLDEVVQEKIRRECTVEIDTAFELAESEPWPDIATGSKGAIEPIV